MFSTQGNNAKKYFEILLAKNCQYLQIGANKHKNDSNEP